MSELEEFRADKDAFFREHPQSPLHPGPAGVLRGARLLPEG